MCRPVEARKSWEERMNTTETGQLPTQPYFLGGDQILDIYEFSYQCCLVLKLALRTFINLKSGDKVIPCLGPKESIKSNERVWTCWRG
jgi:hypothetical protein